MTGGILGRPFPLFLASAMLMIDWTDMHVVIGIIKSTWSMMQFVPGLVNLHLEVAGLLTGRNIGQLFIEYEMTSKVVDTNTHVQRASTSDLLVNIPPHSIKLRFPCLHKKLVKLHSNVENHWGYTKSHTESRYLICGCTCQSVMTQRITIRAGRESTYHILHITMSLEFLPSIRMQLTSCRRRRNF
jgi:hypothetical protein